MKRLYAANLRFAEVHLRRIPALLLAVVLALAVGIVPAPTLLLAAPVAQADDPAVLDYYESELIEGEGDAPDLVVGLILYEDGTAEVISDYQNDADVITEVGSWVDNGDSTVTLTVTGTTDAAYAAPIELAFDVAEDGSLVVPGAENGAFGEAGLVLLPTALGNSDAILAQIPANALVYQSDVIPAASGPGLQLTLALLDDGSLRMFSDYMSEGEIVAEAGTWSEAEDGSLVVTLLGQENADDGTLTEYEAPLEFIFTVNEDGSLVLVDEGGALFGEAGLTLLPTEATGAASEVAAGEEGAEEAPAEEEGAEEEATPAPEEEAPEAATEEGATEEETADESATAETVITDTVSADTVITDTVDSETAITDTVDSETAITETGVLSPSAAYVSDLLPSDDESGTFLVALFYEDGSALVSTYTLNGDLPVLEVGTWAGNEDGTYTITATGTVDEEYDEPVEVVFTIDEDGIISISGVPLHPLQDANLAAGPGVEAEFQSDPITDTIDFTHTLTLLLYDDSSAELITDYLEEEEVSTEYGEWAFSEANDTITVTLTSDDNGDYDEPVEWLFEANVDDTIVLLNDEEGYYGEDGLTLFGVAPAEVGATDEAVTEEGVAEGETGLEEAEGAEEEAAPAEGVQVFQSEVLPAASSPGLQLTLGLQDDGSAALDYDYLDGEEVITNLGEWVDNGDDTITITFTEGPTGTLELPVELTLELDGDGNLVITDASEESLGLLDVVLAPIVLE